MEKYLKREVRDPSERSKVRGRLLAFKVSNALREETFVRKQFEKSFSYIKNRWGHHGLIMQQFNINMQHVISEVWTEGRRKIKSKLEFLAGKRSKP